MDANRGLDWLAHCLLAFQHGERDEDGRYSENARLGALWQAQLLRVQLQSMTQKGGE